MTSPTAADEAKYAAFMRAVLHYSSDRTAERLTAAAGALNGVEAYVVAMLAVMWDDMSATEAERDALRARAEAAEAALAIARAEGAAAERAAILDVIRKRAGSRWAQAVVCAEAGGNADVVHAKASECGALAAILDGTATMPRWPGRPVEGA